MLVTHSSTSSHKWETYRRRRFGRFSRRRATSILRSVRKERATQKIGQSAIGPPGWLEKGPSASLLVRQVSQRIRSSLAPSIQTLLKPTVCLPLMRRCTSATHLFGELPCPNEERSIPPGDLARRADYIACRELPFRFLSRVRAFLDSVSKMGL